MSIFNDVLFFQNREEKICHRVRRIFKIWEEREVYSSSLITDLCSLLEAPLKMTKSTNLKSLPDFEVIKKKPNITISSIKRITCSPVISLHLIVQCTCWQNLEVSKSGRRHWQETTKLERITGIDSGGENDLKRNSCYMKTVESIFC